jgi:hypothetical protein
VKDEFPELEKDLINAGYDYEEVIDFIHSLM